jgi:hypothetical protein
VRVVTTTAFGVPKRRVPKTRRDVRERPMKPTKNDSAWAAGLEGVVEDVKARVRGAIGTVTGQGKAGRASSREAEPRRRGQRG